MNINKDTSINTNTNANINQNEDYNIARCKVGGDSEQQEKINNFCRYGERLHWRESFSFCILFCILYFVLMLAAREA